MPRIKRLFFTLSIILLTIFLTSSGFASEIEIKPVLEGKEYYIMELGEIQTFEACGLGWDEEKGAKISDTEIQAIQWAFDSRFLELVGKKDETITLKAIKARTSKLTVTGKVEDKEISKTIFIVTK